MLDVSSTTSNAEIARWGARPQGGGDKRASAALPLLDDAHRHRHRPGVLHPPPSRPHKMMRTSDSGH